MKLLDVSGCPYEDHEGQVLSIRYRLSENEAISVGDMISIELMDDSVIDREVKILNPKYAGDFLYVSQKAKRKVESGEYGVSARVMTVKGPCIATVVVMNVAYHDVKTEAEVAAREKIAEQRRMCCVSPYKEIRCGSESIYNHVVPGYAVPAKVIAYLQTTEPYLMSPGIYDHPFRKGKKLLGPYMYTDGHYWWDRDTWKYVLKYHVELPQEFIEHVMSDAGTAFLNSFAHENKSWACTIADWKSSSKDDLCLLPADSGDISLENF